MVAPVYLDVVVFRNLVAGEEVKVALDEEFLLTTHVSVAEHAVLCSGAASELSQLGEEVSLVRGEVFPEEFLDGRVGSLAGEERDALPGQHVGEASLEDLLLDLVQRSGRVTRVHLLDIHLHGRATGLHDMYTR